MVADGPSWSDIAEWYDELLQSGSGPHETALRCLDGLIPELDGTDVIDVACGQGIASRHLASRGARVIGIDSSAAMVDLAHRHGTPTGFDISYLVDDAQTLSRFEDSTFDGAVCQLGLMDIEDLDASLAAINRVLKPGGWFAFVISHPCFLGPDSYRTETPTGPGLAIAGYFEERFWRSTNPEGVRRAGTYHRTLSTYINALTHALFRIEVADEPHPNELLAEQHPLNRNVPIFFAARVRSISELGALGSGIGDQDHD
jgi:SAM-dependent methyltransferase